MELGGNPDFNDQNIWSGSKARPQRTCTVIVDDEGLYVELINNEYP